MNPTVVYWLVIAGLCLLFPPLLGFVLGITLFCVMWWVWFKVRGANHVSRTTP